MALDRTWYNTLVNDDGSNTTGTLWDKTAVDALMDAVDALPAAGSTFTAHGVLIGNGTSALAVTGAGTAGQVLTSNGASADPTFQAAAGGGAAVVQTTTSTGTVNDFALTAGATQLRCNNATLLTLTGLSAGTAGQRLVIVSVGAGQVDLTNEGAGSTAANRMIQGVTGTRSLSPGSGTALLEYDGTTARWRVIAHEQGAWITPAFAAGNFTGSGSLVVTVEAGDVLSFGYRLSGRTLQVAVDIRNFTTSGTGAEVRLAIPGGFTAARNARALVMVTDSGTTRLSLWESTAAITYVKCYADLTAPNWAASTNQSNVIGQLFFDVS